ncbi:MAG: hypothetical protein ACLUD2_07650 [Clostridium sp.]
MRTEPAQIGTGRFTESVGDKICFGLSRFTLLTEFQRPVSTL